MSFIHVDPSTKEKIHQVNDHIQKGKPAFILVYMEGCGPCNATRPEWEKLKNSITQIQPDILITDIEQSLSNQIHRFPPPMGFPTMKFIHGPIIENYEDCKDIERKDRTFASFLSWIDSKTTKPKPKQTLTKKTKKQKGGRRRKRRTRHSRRRSHKK